MKILTADIGGTHTRFEVFQYRDHGLYSLASEKYSNAGFDSFESVLARFLDREEAARIDAAGFAVAGPVAGGRCHLTNLDWVLDEGPLGKGHDIGPCHLLNDFAAIPYGVDDLPPEQVTCLQPGRVEVPGVRAFVGPGTGLGQAISLPTSAGLQVLATEAGHADFAPGSERQLALVSRLRTLLGPVSNEALLSGCGLVNIYRDLVEAGVGREVGSVPTPQQITEAARQGDGLAMQTLALFFEILGSYLGNVALQTLPRGGLYLAGGIVPRILDMMEREKLLAAYRDKAKMRELLDDIPIFIILDEAVARLGAARYVLMRLGR